MSTLPDLSALKPRLQELREQTLVALEQLDDASQTVTLDQNRVGRLSRMDAMQGQAMAQASRSRQHHLLIQIDQALRDMDAGDYGRCRECDNWIAQARLELDPVVELCIQCAQLKE